MICSSPFEDIDSEIKSRMVPVGKGKWERTECQYCSWLSNVYNHIEIKHVGATIYDCPICGKQLKGRNSFNSHMSHSHKNSIQ